MVKFINVGKVYENFELDKINFSIEKGEIVGIVGQNGAGKTTILKIITGIIRKFYGEIEILGNKVYDSNKNENIGVVFDECPFIPKMTAEKINYSFSGIYKTWDENKFFELIKKFGIERNKKVGEYSKGMTVKLQIAVALSHDSKLLILDEPTNGLDPLSKDLFLDLLYEFMEQDERSIIITSHIISDIEKICDKVLFINAGKIVFFKHKEEIFEQYALLKCTNEEYLEIDKSKIIGDRKNEYSVECLVLKEHFPINYILDKASIEDVLVFTIRGMK